MTTKPTKKTMERRLKKLMCGYELPHGTEFKDLVAFIKEELIKELEELAEECHQELKDAELYSIPEGKYKEGYLMGYSDCLETLEEKLKTLSGKGSK